MEPTLGYIVLEPDLSVARVPDRLLRREDILWPAQRNLTPGLQPGLPVPFFGANEFYHRHFLSGTSIAVFVRAHRDPEALPGAVTAAIRARAEHDGAAAGGA